MIGSSKPTDDLVGQWAQQQQATIKTAETHEDEEIISDEEIIEGVLDEFYPTLEIPHCTKYEQRVSDYLISRLAEMGIYGIQDERLNIIADIPATAGYEAAPLTIVQGHMDMVCAATKGSDYDPKVDAIHVLIEGDILKTDGRSSLGADSGAGNSVILFILDKLEFKHGPLRLIFTVEEEVGLQGAKAIDAKYFRDAKYLINVDGFKEGKAVVGSAGGRRESFTRALTLKPVTLNVSYRLDLDHFLGGHSGYDIDRGRANTIKLMAILLHRLLGAMPLEVANFHGGVSSNAIPGTCTTQVVIDRARQAEFMAMCTAFGEELQQVYAETDPEGTFKVTEVPLPTEVWQHEAMLETVECIHHLFNGVYCMNPTIKDVVNTSSNVGKISALNGQITVGVFTRSRDKKTSQDLNIQHTDTAHKRHFAMALSEYNGWSEDINNTLAQMMSKAYFEATGKELVITAQHVGLEPSVFLDKNPNLTMINAGADVINPHSVDEHVVLSSIPPYARMIYGTLEKIAEDQD